MAIVETGIDSGREHFVFKGSRAGEATYRLNQVCDVAAGVNPGTAEVSRDIGINVERAFRTRTTHTWNLRKIREHLVAQLQDWCLRAEASGVAPLVAFSRRLRTYS